MTHLKRVTSYIDNRTNFGDKIYCNVDFWSELEQTNNFKMPTPIKDINGQHESQKKREKAYNSLFSKGVSSVRQPIESLFNWLIEKIDIQRASKVLSTKGLLTYLCGRIAAAFI